MNQEQKIERMKELIELLNRAGRAYYQESREIMSNFEYDRLYDELAGLERETKTVFGNSPTQNVGYEVASSLVKAHALPEQDKERGGAEGVAGKRRRTFVLENGRPDDCADL